MLRIYKLHLPKSLLILAGIEITILFASFYVGLFFSWVEFEGKFVEFIEFLPDAALYSIVSFIAIFSVGGYNRENIRKLVETIIRLFVGFVISFVVLTAIFYSLPIMGIWRSVIGFAMTAAFLSIVFVRYIAVHTIDLNLLKRRIVVIGVGDRAGKIEALTSRGQALGFICIGYLNVGGEERTVPSSRIIPPVNSLVDFINQERVDEIVVAVRDRRRRLPMQELTDCRLSGITIVDYMTFYACETGRIDLDALQPGWFLYSDGFRGSRSYRLLKRTVDIAASLVFLCLLLPVIILATLAIWLDSPGSILHRQARVGQNGQTFVLLKFRSMRADAEDEGVPRWAAPNDPRVTRVGAFLRRTRIDEIPQFINILKGEMSFAGPRPERPQFVERFSQEIPYYADRHSIKPGLTGWAQLNHHYGASLEDARSKLEYDLYYMIFCGFFLDILIILQTIRVIIWPNGVR